MNNREPEEVGVLDILASFVAALRRNLLLTLLLPIVGMIAGIVYSFTKKDVYESSMLLQTSLLTAHESEFLFEQLEKVDTIPGLTFEQDRQVRKFITKVLPGDDTPLNEKSIYLQITARVTKKDVLPVLEQAFLDFVDSSDPVSRHRAERRRYYDEMIAKIDKEIAAMDDVKKNIPGNTQATYLNPSELYSQTVGLHSQRTEFEIRRNQVSAIHLIKGFDALLVTKRPNPVIFAIAGFLVGFAVLCVLLFVGFFMRYLRAYESR